MKKFFSTLAALVIALALPSFAIAQATYTAEAGVSLFTGVTASATHTSAAVRLPTYSGAGTLNFTGVGITGSPSGCTFVLKYQQNNSTTATGTISSTSITPATGTQQFTISPSVANGDNYIAVYACSSTYPTAGTFSVSFSPARTGAVASGTVGISNTGDPCLNPNVAKSSASVAISTATTTQVVAISGTKATYVCGFNATFGASTTAQFEYGTSTDCTGTHALSGVMVPATGAFMNLQSNGTVFGAPASNGLCIVSTGTGGINGALSYVQQ